ncbi:MAG: molybdopterin-dependent oxidoreductase [Thermodesulfobacteriota bacterium]
MTITRRTILKALNALLLTLAAPIAACRSALAERFPTRTVERDNFKFDPSTGLIRWKKSSEKDARTEPYFLVVEGLVETPLKLSYPQLRALAQHTQVNDFHCVEGWTIPQVKWSGFRFKELADLVNPSAEAKYVTFHSLGETRFKPAGQTHYVESFDLAALLDPHSEILLVVDMDGKPLSHDRGAPIRIIAPTQLAYKSIKFVHRVEFVKERQLGWWSLANPIYRWDAPVSPTRRLIEM